jgi:hypothetical protein
MPASYRMIRRERPELAALLTYTLQKTIAYSQDASISKEDVISKSEFVNNSNKGTVITVGAKFPGTLFKGPRLRRSTKSKECPNMYLFSSNSRLPSGIKPNAVRPMNKIHRGINHIHPSHFHQNPNQSTMRTFSPTSSKPLLNPELVSGKYVFRISMLITLFFICLGSGISAQTITSTAIGGNWNAVGTWVGGVIPTNLNSSLVVIDGPVNVTSNVTAVGLTINATKTLTMSGTSTLGASGNFTVNGTFSGGAGTGTITIGGNTNVNGSLALAAGSFNCAGTTTLSGTGTLTDNNNTGTNTFTGLVTVNSGTSLSTANNSAFIFGGGISNDGTFSKTGTGAVTFNNTNSIGGTAAITLAGAVAFNGSTTINNSASTSFPGAVTIATGITVTNQGTVSITGALNGANASTSVWINDINAVLNYSNTAAPMATGVLNASASPNTVHYSTGAQTIKGTSYNVLSMAGGAVTKTLGGNTVVATAFTIPASTTLQLSSFNFTASSTTTVSGILNDNNSTGTNTFSDDITIASGGSLTTSNNPVFVFGGNITNNGGTFNKAGTGAVTLSAPTTQLSGSASIFMNGTVTANSVNTTHTAGTVSFAGGLNASGNLSLTGSATVQLAVAASTPVGPSSTIGGNLIVNSGNTLNLGNGAVTITGTSSISGTVQDNGSTTALNTFNGEVTIHAGGILQILNGVSVSPIAFNSNVTNAGSLLLTSTSGAITFNGNVTNTGTFSRGNSTPTTANMTFGGPFTFSSTNNITSYGPVVVSANGSITGSGSFFFNGTFTISSNITMTNEVAMSVTGNLNGSNAGSTFINAANASLTYTGTNLLMGSGVLDASASNNTINYNGANQTIKQGTYYHIGFGGSGTKTFATDIIVNGNFTRSAGTMVFNAGQTTTFASGSTANFTAGNTSFTFQNVVINKSGGSLTIVPGGAVTTTCGTLTVTAGSLNLGTTNTTLLVSGDLSGAGNLDMSGATHQVTLNGVNNNIGSLTSNPNTGLGTITYNRGGTTNQDQNIFGSPNYRNLVLSMASGTSKTITLNGNIAVSANLNFLNNVRVVLGSNDIKIKATGQLISNAAFGSSRMFVTDGTGVLVKEGASVTSFITDMYGTGMFPVGNSGGLYTPFEILTLSASVTPTASIAVRAVPTRQPNIPYYNNALIKYWDIETANIASVTANLRFTYNATEVIGSATLYTPRQWNGVTLSTPAGTAASTPFTVTGANSLAGQWSAADPTIRTTLYSYQTGDWSNADTWTTDPSGSTLISPIVPGAGDQVVILNGRTVTTAISRTVGQLEIQSGGTLDIGSTTGHNFGSVSGEGTLRLSSGTFPGGTYTSFTSSIGGTVEYYDIPAATTLSTQNTYNNLTFSNSTATAFTATTASSVTLNGHLVLNRSSSGTVTLSLPNAGPFTFTVGKDVTIGNGCTWNIAPLATQEHNVRMNGNLINNGTIDFQNGVAFSATTGRAIVTFGGSTINTTATFNALSSAEFFRVVMSKNDGYELYMSSSPSATVNFHGNEPALMPTLGTLRLGPNLNVTNLNPAGGNYDLGSPGVLPTFWIDGATVTFGTSSGAIVPYGTLRITAGTLNVLTGQQAVVVRESGLFQIDGGTVNIGIFRTSTTATTHRGSFAMSGGTLNLNGVISTESSHYSIFSLPYPENVFKMSGGVINITRLGNTGISLHGGIMIASAQQNYDVTGGQINVRTSGNTNFDITSTAPFYNMNIGRATAGTGITRLNAINWSYDGNVGNTATITAKPLTILNDLILETSNAPVFNTLGNNIQVNGNFTVNTGSTLTSATNTITFGGNTAQNFVVSGTITAPGLGSITVNKGAASSLTLGGSAPTISATGNLTLSAGILNDNGKTLFVAGNVTNNATHAGSGKISLNGSSAQTIGGNGTGVYQNLEIAGTAGASVGATNNININGNLNFSSNRILGLSIYRLIVSGAASITSTSGSFSSARFISTDGFQSDGGIVKTFNSTSPFLFPFGTGSNYTPATIQFSATPGSWGTLDVRPVTARQLYVTDLNTFIYYWKVRGTGFSGIPAGSINHTFNYGNLADDVSYIPAYYNYQAIAYTPINDVSQVDEATNNIHFTGVSYFNGDFTAGSPAAFGIVVPYYSRANGNWNAPATWSNTGHGGPASLTVPSSSTPVFIGDGVGYFHNVTVNANNTYAGSLIIDAGSALSLGTTTGHNFGALPYSTAGGAGTVRISSSTSVAEFPAGDFGIFFTEEGGTTEYFTTGAQTFSIPLVTASPTSAQIRTYRNLVLNPGPGGTINMPDRDIEIYENLTVMGDGIAALNETSSRTLTVNNDIHITGGTLRYRNNSSQHINLKGNLNISPSGIFDVDNSGSIAHTITLDGNLTNNGTLEFNQLSDVNITFNGNESKKITGTNAGASTSFNRLILNKGNSKALSLEIDVPGTLLAPSNNWLTLSNGTLILSKAANITLNNQAGSTFLIPFTSGLTLNHAGAVGECVKCKQQ